MSGFQPSPGESSSLQTTQLHAGNAVRPGQLLASRFRIIEALGAGAQASVYSAFDEMLGVDVALKVLGQADTDAVTLQNLRNEVVVARQIQHPNIIRVHDIFCDQDYVFFTMAFVPGQPLQQRLHQPVSRQLYQRWEQQLLEAVQACQGADIHHGDIKPDNILITDDDTLMLIDFGIGQAMSSRLQTSGHQHYAAPEVLTSGTATAQSDIYSAGQVLKDVLAAVALSKLSLRHAWWRLRQQQRLARLTHRQPGQRPALSVLLTQRRRWSPVWAGALVIVAVGLAVLLLRSPQTDSPVLPDKTLQVVMIADPDFPLLATIARLLRYPLALHPGLALVPASTSHNLIDNLALAPVANPSHRIDLATTTGADMVLMLNAAPANGDTYLLTASGLLMPADKAAFSLSQTVSLNSLDQDIQNFSQRLLSQLFSALDYEVALPDVSYLSSLSLLNQQGEPRDPQAAVEALVDAAPGYPGSWLASAQLALQQNDIAWAREALATLFSFDDLPAYWQLQGNLVRARLDDNLPLAEQSIDALIAAYPDRAELLAERARIKQWANNLPAAADDLHAALKLQPHNGDLWFELAKIQINSGDIDIALESTLTEALVAYRRNQNRFGESQVFNAFGVSYLRLAQYDSAASYLNDALKLLDSEQYPAERTKTLANLAIVASIKGDFASAQQNLEEALVILETIGDKEEEAHVLDTLGFLHEEQGRYTSALNYYKEGLDLRVQTGDVKAQPLSMSNVAYAHFLIGDMALAEIYWQQALALFSRNEEETHRLRTQQNLIHLAMVKGDNTAAAQQLGQLSEQLGSDLKQEQLYQHLLLSYLHFSRGNVQQALDQVHNANAMAAAADDVKAQVESALWLAEVCLKLADWQCSEQALAKTDSQINDASLEQQAVHAWLSLALQHQQGSPVDEQHPVYQQLVANDHLPTLVSLKIMLDMQERFALPPDSDAMQRAEMLNQPVLYQPYLHWLYLHAKRGDTQYQKRLRQQLAVHPQYWRNHIYYQAVPGAEAKARQLRQAWLNQLNEQQAGAYQETYFD